jgi:signal transduction histidine kinase
MGKGTREREPVDLNQMIEETVSMVSDQAARTDVSIFVEPTFGIPLVLGDKVQLQQVLLNHLMNAIEAMSETIERERILKIRSEEFENGLVRVSISDTGKGIATETMKRLFEPFFTTRAQGAGVGLAISSSIIEAHGGRIWAESVPNQGAIFLFTLPQHHRADD